MRINASHVWSIILARGNGCRMQPFIKQWLGQGIPKQYSSFMGERSMFQHNLERADQFTHREQKITVISQAHEEFASPQMSAYPGGGLLLEPRSCDTGPGVFLPLSYLTLLAADATVVIFPSDHFIFPLIGFFIFSRLVSMPWKIFRNNLFFLESVPRPRRRITGGSNQGSSSKKWASAPLSSSILY